MTQISAAQADNLKDFPKLYWQWLPLLMILVMIIGRAMFPDWKEYEYYIESEARGIVENAAFAILVPAVIFGFLAWRMRAALPTKYLGYWLMLCTIAVFIAAGEEASWGQHWFNWATPDALAAINDHGETNLHNTLNGYDTTIKSFIIVGMVIGTMLIPLFMRFRGLAKPAMDNALYWIFPTVIGLPVTIYCLTSRVFRQLFQKWTRLDEYMYFDMDLNELSEFYIACFLFFYLFSFWYRLRQVNAAAA